MHLSAAYRLAWIVLLSLGCAEPPADPVARQTGPTDSPAVRSQPEVNDAATDADDSTVDDRSVERLRLVRDHIERQGIDDPAVLEAMRTVPRHWFVPENVQRLAYGNWPLPIGEGQTISQPSVVALMTEQLELEEGDKVLEVGTGSGYQAAVLSEITPHVFTIEIVEPLARRAIETFEKRGYESIQVKIGDGYAGWPEHAPFDAIIVTAAPEHVPQPLIDQLKPGGRMVIPVGGQDEVQHLRVLTKATDGTVEDQTLIPVRFVPMTGNAQKPTKSEAAK